MSPANAPSLSPPAAGPYHEFYRDASEPREHYRPLWERMRAVGPLAIAARARDVHHDLGSDLVARPTHRDAGAGIEPMPSFDPIPRIIPASDWARIEAGLAQRVRALNLFLDDLHHARRIVKDGVVPAELVYGSPDFRPDVVGVEPPHGIHTHVGGIDVVRDEHGRYLVLDDNLRTPSGISIMVENRTVARGIFPELFGRYRIRRVEDAPARLLQVLRAVSPRATPDPRIVVLTSGTSNPAYFEHTFLAMAMGVDLAEGRDLVVSDGVVFLKTTRGRERVDVVYRRIDDLFLDPLRFRSDSLIGVPGIVDAWRAGNVAIVNAPGSGVADDKAVYPYVPSIIRYYLGEAPLLGNVPTYRMTNPAEREWVLAHLDRVIVKRVNEPGGYGMLIGPTASPELRAAFARRILEHPRSFIAQALVPPSRHLCSLDGDWQARHVDLRSFVFYGEEIEVIPGGLTRVALTRGAPAVDPSQGRGTKDTWVLAEERC